MRPRPSPRTNPSLLSTQDLDPDEMTLYPTTSKLMIYSSVRNMLPTWWRELTWLWKKGYNWSFTRFLRIWNQCQWSFSLTISPKTSRIFEIRKGDKPVQRSLGISWDINPDVFTFTFKISSDQKPFTRMEVLSTINSLFDPPPPPWIRISSNCAREDIILAYATNLQWNRLGQSFWWLHPILMVGLGFSVHHLEDVRISRMYSKYFVCKSQHESSVW